jgi:bifunctional DNase/RNase
MMIPVIVESVRMNLGNGQRVVILKTKLDRYLLIWVGLPESQAIALELQNEKAPRPLTADLLKTVIDELGARRGCADYRDRGCRVSCAYQPLNATGEALDIDARAADAIGLAVRADVPIYVEDAVLDDASITLPNEEEDEKLDVYRDFVEQLFASEEVSVAPTRSMADLPSGQERLLKELIGTYRCAVCRQGFERDNVRVAARHDKGWIVSVRCALSQPESFLDWIET